MKHPRLFQNVYVYLRTDKRIFSARFDAFHSQSAILAGQLHVGNCCGCKGIKFNTACLNSLLIHSPNHLITKWIVTNFAHECCSTTQSDKCNSHIRRRPSWCPNKLWRTPLQTLPSRVHVWIHLSIRYPDSRNKLILCCPKTAYQRWPVIFKVILIILAFAIRFQFYIFILTFRNFLSGFRSHSVTPIVCHLRYLLFIFLSPASLLAH
eukprot:Gb_07836 [translate_table: standard]